MRPLSRTVTRRPTGRTASRARRIAILGWYGSGNAGDEAVLQAIVEALRCNGFTNLLALSTNPPKTAARYGIASVKRSPLNPPTLRAVWNADALILGGGGLIQDSSSVYNLPLYAFYVALARFRRLPVLGWGIGVGPLYTKLGRWLARFIFNASVYFSVRDWTAKQALALAGIQPTRIRVSADSAFLIERGAATPGLHQVDKPTVIFCIRHRLHDQPGLNLRYLLPVSVRHRLGLETRPGAEEDTRFISAMARGVRLCTGELGAQVALLPFWAERDDEVLRAIEQEAITLGAPPEAITWAHVEHTPSALAAYIAEADLLVSMRLHALIFGAAAGVPMLALSYVPKVRSLMRLLGAERWVIEVQTRVPSPEEVEMKLRQIWRLRQAEGEKLRQRAETMQRRAEQDAARIAEIL